MIYIELLRPNSTLTQHHRGLTLLKHNYWHSTSILATQLLNTKRAHQDGPNQVNTTALPLNKSKLKDLLKMARKHILEPQRSFYINLNHDADEED